MSFASENQATHVVLLTIDCLRADAARGMDTLSSLMDARVDVPDCQCTGSGTPTSMSGIMQSRLPTDHGGKPHRHPLVPEVPTLAEALSAAGFTCAGWHSNPNTSREYEYQRGFDVFSDLTTDPPDRPTDGRPDPKDDGSPLLARIGKPISQTLGLEEQASNVWSVFQRLGLVPAPLPYVRTERVVDAIHDWFPAEPTGTPHFAWGHLMDLHDPYVPPPEYRRRVPDCPEKETDISTLNEALSTPQSISDSEARQLRGMYDAAGLYVDDQIERLIETLHARDLWEDTLLVITSDHGEMFKDRPIPDDYAFRHPNYVCDYITHVPLVFAGGGLPDERVGGIASGADVAPTIVSLVGGDVPEQWNGTVIGGPAYADRPHVYSLSGRGKRQDHTPGEIPINALNVALRTEHESVLWWSLSAHDPEFYDREMTHEDPTVHEVPVERDSIAGSETYIDSIVDRFGDVAARHGSRLEEGMPEPDEAVAERLRQLGYVE